MRQTMIEIITIGNEYLEGGKPVGVSDYLGKKLNDNSLMLTRRAVLPANIEVCCEEISKASERADILILTGTMTGFCDFTSDVLCRIFSAQKVKSEKMYEHVHHEYKKREHKMSHTLERKLVMPCGASEILYPGKPLSGFYFKNGEKLVFALPGDVDDIANVWDKYASSDFISQYVSDIKCTRIGVVGVTFDSVQRTAGHLQKDFPSAEIVATKSIIDAQIRITGTQEVVDKVISAAKNSSIGNFIYGVDKSIVKALVELLKLKGETITAAESCTGGLVAKLITDVPGSSMVFPGSLVTYSESTKIALADVHASTISKHSVISNQVATEMAIGARHALNTTYSIGITGLAGPGVDDSGKEVGTVYIAITKSGKSKVQKYHFTGDRETIRLCAARTAIRELYLEVKK